MIDVEAVCAEWVRLGGVAHDGSGTMTLYGADLGIAAFVRGEHTRLFVTTDDIDGDLAKTTAEVLAALPALAEAWGVTKAPEVLTWDEAAALWVEWGGVSLPHDSSRCARLRADGGMGAPQVYLPDGPGGVLFQGAGASGYANADVTLTRDALEEMAEVCGLPAVPGAVEQLPFTIEDVGFEGMAEHIELEANAARVFTPQPPPVDQWAEASAEYDARLRAFVGVG